MLEKDSYKTTALEKTMILPYTDEEGKTKVKELFIKNFNTNPQEYYKAPGRINIIGEHVDYNSGICLPMALQHCAFIAVKQRKDTVVKIYSAQEKKLATFNINDISPNSNTDDIKGWVSYIAGVFWAFKQAGYENIQGCEIALDSCVPYGAGLSSSAAIECVVAIYIADKLNINLNDETKTQIANICVKAENEIAGAPTGGLDQAASMRCEKNKVLSLDCLDFSAQLLSFPIEKNNMKMLIVDTQAPHKLVDGQYSRRRQICEKVAQKLKVNSLRKCNIDDFEEYITKLDTDEEKKYLRHVLTEIERTKKFIEIIKEKNIYSTIDKQKLGALMTASHESLKNDYKVSCPELDLAVDTMNKNGAWGARMTGGGFGGCAIGLIEEKDIKIQIEKILKAFAEKGYTTPKIMVATASSGAEKITK